MDIWEKVVEKANLHELKAPRIEYDKFIFQVTNELEENVYKEHFNTLNEVYYSLTEKTAEWITEVGENKKREPDPTKKSKFEEFSKISPIVDKLNDLFNLDLT